jgi:hypothetical protein
MVKKRRHDHDLDAPLELDDQEVIEEPEAVVQSKEPTQAAKETPVHRAPATPGAQRIRMIDTGSIMVTNMRRAQILVTLGRAEFVTE